MFGRQNLFVAIQLMIWSGKTIVGKIFKVARYSIKRVVGIAGYLPLRSAPVCHSSVFLVDHLISATTWELFSLSGNGFLSIQIVESITIRCRVVVLQFRVENFVANPVLPSRPELLRPLNSNRSLSPVSWN